ncbi:hypothetical protein C2E23DRAFT_742439 [Lenzites betulinus]|nr:hypothetical protein C2E23DRAFT_742439 [Lenzites betulinus]
MNIAYRLPKTTPQTNQTAEAVAITRAAEEIPRDRALMIESDSKTIIAAITTLRSRHEDIGYIGVKNQRVIRKLVEELRKRETPTWIKWVKGHAGHRRNEEADRLARKGAEMEETDLGTPSVGREPTVRWAAGAKLSAITQKLAYRAIRLRKMRAEKERPSTKENMNRTLEEVKRDYGVERTAGNIWSSFTGRHITKECRQYLWRTMHDGFMVGRHWARPRMPDELRARAICKKCDVLETMPHILLECRAEGEETCWKKLKQLIEIAGLEWKEPTWGVIMGAPGMRTGGDAAKARDAGATLWKILWTETSYLVWKLRCERVIQSEGKEHTTKEVESRWTATINRRLNLDRRTALMKGSGLTAAEVEEIWYPILKDKENLPTDWVLKTGVLVGIGP